MYQALKHSVTWAGILFLGGCALWRPQLGMSVDEFDEMCRKSGLSWQSRIVEAEGKRESRACGGAMYYYFLDGRLVRIDQGQLPLQRIEVQVK
jgi:hypothetical protein